MHEVHNVEVSLLFALSAERPDKVQIPSRDSDRICCVQHWLVGGLSNKPVMTVSRGVMPSYPPDTPPPPAPPPAPPAAERADVSPDR